MSVILFFLVIFVLVLVHEFGHFWVAKKTGMRVDEFGIGFPPKVASIKKGETEYSFNLLPIGGFVRIFGEDAADAVGSPDEKRSFIAKSPLQQTAVLVAGVTANMIFAWLLFIAVYALGVPTVVDEAAASPEARLVIAEVLPGSPAEKAGIERGAVITSIKTEEATLETLTVSSFKDFTSSNADIPLTVAVSHAGEARELVLIPTTNVIENEPNQVAVGVALAMVEVVRTPILEAVVTGTVETYQTFMAVTAGMATLLWDTVRLEADLSSVAGPVGIVGLVDEAAQFGLTSLLMFTALISVNLAVINLLPFPALDGGRLLFVLIEVIKGSRMNPVWVMRLNTIGFFLLIALMVAVTWSDISKLL